MYRALYRKWRPLRFQDVVGQTAIVSALRNQIAHEHVGHAYLFTGVRGTGKTTCAKIFAKAVNCLTPVDGDPCGECEVCRGLENDSILDVVEMDAASNNGVDNIRDLRDETAYTPSACKYKVYIIDEVHMLSTQAFNALLKTLEEPPPHVVFILATTEIQKVPATILSRCQRYDFTRIQPDDLAARAMYVAEQENLSLTQGAADLIARLADGALRDTLSILDTCAGVTSEIDQEVVRRMAGVTDRNYLFYISECIAKGDGVAALAELANLRQKSVDLKRLAEELIQHYRNLMLACLPNGSSLLTGVSPEEEARYLETCKQIPQAESIRAIRTLGAALEKMSRGNDQRIELELAFFSLTEPAPTAQAAAYPPAQQVARAASPAPFASAPTATTAPAPFASAPVVAPVVTPTQVPTSTPVPQPTAPSIPVVNSSVTSTPSAPVAPILPIVEATPVPITVTPTAESPVAPPVTVTPTAVEPAKAPVPSPVAPFPIPSEPEVPAPTVSDREAPPLMEPELPSYAEMDIPPEPEAPPTAQDLAAAPLPWDNTLAPSTTPAVKSTKLSPLAAEAKERAAAEAKAAQAAKTASDATATETTASANGAPVPFAPWPEIRTILAKRDPMLAGYIRTSNAYRQNKRILIEGGKMFRDFIRVNKDSQALIKAVLYEVTQEQFAIGPYDPQTQTRPQASAEDTLRALQAKGLNVTITDDKPKR